MGAPVKYAPSALRDPKDPVSVTSLLFLSVDVEANHFGPTRQDDVPFGRRNVLVFPDDDGPKSVVKSAVIVRVMPLTFMVTFFMASPPLNTRRDPHTRLRTDTKVSHGRLDTSQSWANSRVREPNGSPFFHCRPRREHTLPGRMLS